MSFDEAFTVRSLEKTYADFKRSRHDVFSEAPRVLKGSDGITLAQFERDSSKHLRAISRKVIQGRYTFAPWRVAGIPKEGGDVRMISIAGIRDALVQRALYNVIYEPVDKELGPYCYGFRREMNAHRAVKEIRSLFARKKTFVFDADIEKFFDRVRHSTLMSKLAPLGLDDRATKLVWRFLRTGHIERVQEDGSTSEVRTHVSDIGLPQGGVLSGLLANLYLAEFDRAISAKVPGLVRYADDFVVCCVSADQCALARAVAAQELGKVHLALHPKKTKDLVLAEDGVDFVGFTITPTSTRIRQSNVDRFKSRINTTIDEWVSEDDPARSNEDALRDLVWRLSFKIRGPDQRHIEAMIDIGLLDHPYRRNWPAFFRIVDDEEQFRDLDRWVRTRISEVMAHRRQCRVTLKDMRRLGLPSLVNACWKSRRRTPAK